jgi:uncharacterized membrane protein
MDSKKSQFNQHYLVAAIMPIMAYFVSASFLHNANPWAVQPFMFFSVLATILYTMGIVLGKSFLRWTVLIGFVFLVNVFLMTLVVSARFGAEPLYPQDGSRQIEAAVRMIGNGTNPYVANFASVLPQANHLNTIDGQTITNPVIQHFVYLPGQLILAAVFVLPIESIIGWSDVRILNWLIFAVIVGYLIWKKNYSEWQSQLFLLIFFFNPLFFTFMLEGRGDALLLSLIILILLTLEKRSYILAAILFGFALAFRQTLWFLLPFILFYILQELKSKRLSSKILKDSMIVSVIVTLIFVLPFLFWSPKDFIADTLLYPTGSIETSYPINGFGLGTQLYNLGVIGSVTNYFPFWIPQLLLCLPLLYLLLMWQKKDNTLSRLLLAYATWLCTYWLLSRFFHHNYLGFVSQLLILAWFWEGSQKLDKSL